MKFNGVPAIGIQIAGTEDSNIVEVGRRIDEKLLQLKEELPVGVELHKISWQSKHPITFQSKQSVTFGCFAGNNFLKYLDTV